MSNERIITKIKKCLELSNSPEPHEAIAAMRQAQKLMAKHGLTEAEVGLASVAKFKVECPIQAGKTVPKHLMFLLIIIQTAYGVKAVITSEIRVSDRSWCVYYYGPKHRVEIAAYSHEVIYRALMRGYISYQRLNPHLKGVQGGRMGYMLGYLYAVEKHITPYDVTQDESELMLAYRDHEWGAMEKSKANNMRVCSESLHAGTRDGSEFQLHNAVGGGRKMLTN